MDDVLLKLGRVEGVASKSDNRLSIRVLPELDGVDVEYLPRWPNFFRTKQITGTVGETVWVICNKELTVGYVLGTSNYFPWTGSFKDESISENLWEEFAQVYLDTRGRILNYADLEITFWNQAAIHFIQRSSGASWIIQSSGILHQVGPEDVFISVGNSILQITDDEISLSAKTIRLGREIRLGTNPTGKVLKVPGKLGRNGEPSKDVWA